LVKVAIFEQYLRCPENANHRLTLGPDARVENSEIVSATIWCPECNGAYHIRDGIALMFSHLPASSLLEMEARNNDAPVYASTKPAYETEIESRFFNRYVHVPAGGVVLDEGAGDGRFTHMLARTSASVVLAMDISPEMLRLSRDKAEQTLSPAEADKISYIVADALKPPFATGCADVVVSAQMLEHLQREDHVRCLSEMRRVLKPGGQLAMTIYNLSVGKRDIINSLRTPRYLLSLLTGRYPSDLRTRNRTGFHGEKHDLFYYHQTDSEFDEVLSAAGFQVRKMTGVLTVPRGLLSRMRTVPLDHFITGYLSPWARAYGRFLAASAQARKTPS
jgi:SAM-dependent methyltransferase